MYRNTNRRPNGYCLSTRTADEALASRKLHTSQKHVGRELSNRSYCNKP